MILGGSAEKISPTQCAVLNDYGEPMRGRHTNAVRASELPVALVASYRRCVLGFLIPKFAARAINLQFQRTTATKQTPCC